MIIQYVAIFLLVMLAIDLSLRVYYGRKALFFMENAPPFNVEPTPPQKQASSFEVQTKDGLTLRGSIYHPSEIAVQGVVLFCPETSSCHWSAVRYAQGLMDAGFIVISFDFRSQGESDTLPNYIPMHWVTQYEVNDLQTVIKWIGKQEAYRELPLGLYGISRGGSTALSSISQIPGIKYFACDSSYTNDLLISQFLERWARVIVPKFLFLFYPLSQMRKTLDAAIWFRQRKRNCKYYNIKRPFEKITDKQILLIAGAKDNYVPSRIQREMKRMLGGQCAELCIVPKVNHNGARASNPEVYDSRLIAFFKQMNLSSDSEPTFKQDATSSTDKQLSTT